MCVLAEATTLRGVRVEQDWKWGGERLEPRAGTCTSSYSCSSSAGVISLGNGGGFIDVGLGLSAKEVNGETTAVLQEEALLSVRALRLVSGGHLTDLALKQGHLRLLRVAVQSLGAKRPAVPLWALPGGPA